MSDWVSWLTGNNAPSSSKILKILDQLEGKDKWSRTECNIPPTEFPNTDIYTRYTKMRGKKPECDIEWLERNVDNWDEDEPTLAEIKKLENIKSKLYNGSYKITSQETLENMVGILGTAAKWAAFDFNPLQVFAYDSFVG